MKEIKLTSKLGMGLVALIDDDDFDSVSRHHWWIKRDKNTNYVEAYINGKTVPLHRFLLNPDKGILCDHINGDGLDNRRCNLRIVTNSQNGMNRAATQYFKNRPTSSRFKGVTLHKSGRWVASARRDKIYYHLGRFDNEIEAAGAYNRFARENFGEFARLNEI